MRRRVTARAATLLLALMVALTAVRASALTRCCTEIGDCDDPCCASDGGNATVVPVLPCCRTVALDQKTPEPAPSTVEHDQPSLVALSLTVKPELLALHDPIRATPRALPAAASPLYQQHCALLL
jgi:hypothetical protein